jgi:hypothetical protein
MIEELFRPRHEQNGIPVLTEVILDNDVPSKILSGDEASLFSEKLILQLTQALTQKIESVLDSTLEQELHEIIRTALEQSLAGVRAELQRVLTDTAQKIISRTVQQELAQMTFPPK